MTKEAFYSL